MKFNQNAVKAINNQLKKQGVIEREDEFILRLSAITENNKNCVFNSFVELINELSERIIYNDFTNYDVYAEYHSFMDKIDETIIHHNENFGTDLLEFENEINEILNAYCNIIFTVLSRFGYDYSYAHNYLMVQKKKLLAKTKSVVVDEMAKFNYEIQNKSNELFALVDYIYNKQEEEKQNTEMDCIIDDMQKYHFTYIPTFRELEEIALSNGFVKKSTKGSHVKFENIEKKCVTIPCHNKDIGLGLSIQIQKQIAGVA